MRTGLLAGLAVGAVLLGACGGPTTAPTTSRPPSSTSTSTTTTTGPPRSSTTTTTSTLPPTTTTPSSLVVPAGLAGKEWNVIPTTAKVVALTFDAGANADGVAKILATLATERVRATFFLTGNFVSAYPSAARAIASAGMRLGDHSITHPYFTELTDAEIRHEVLGARSQILSVTGSDPWPWFRFPYFDRNEHTIAVVNSVGFVPIGWTVDTLGWEGTSGGITVSTVVSRVLANLQPGEIVVMHCGSNPTDHSTLDADALPTVIHDVRARGYSFVTLDALLP